MVLFFQILWAIGCVAWNAYGVWLVSNGYQPVAPTSSTAVALLSIGFAFLFWLFYTKKMAKPYMILSAFTALLAFVAVYGGFTKDPSLWANESWRWGGIILNGMGTFAGIVGAYTAKKRKNAN